MSFLKPLEYVVSLVDNHHSPLLRTCVGCWDDWNQLVRSLHERLLEDAGDVLTLFATAVERCSDVTFVADYKQWLNTVIGFLGRSSSSRVLLQLAACHVLATVVRRLCRCSSLARDFATCSLSSTVTSLTRLTQSPLDVQAISLSALSVLLVHYPGQMAQYKGLLKSWAVSGLLNDHHLRLSQECARCLVLLHCDQWLPLVLEVLTYLERSVLLLYAPALGNQPPPLPPLPPQPFLPLPLPTDLEPEKTSLLVTMVTSLCRVLSYAAHTTSKVSFPLERWLSVVGLGLSLHEVLGESTECMLVCSVLPSIHICFCCILETAIARCGDHTLRFTPIIEHWLIRSLTTQRTHGGACPGLKLAIYRVLTLWLSVRKDCDDHFIATVVQCVLEDMTSGHRDIRLTSIYLLQTVVRTVGPILPPVSAQATLNGILRLLSGHIDDDSAGPLLDTLTTCLLVRAPSLTPTLQQASDLYGSYVLRPDLGAMCERGRLVCAMLRHPSVPPSHAHQSTPPSHAHQSTPPSHAHKFTPPSHAHIDHGVIGLQKASKTPIMSAPPPPLQQQLPNEVRGVVRGNTSQHDPGEEAPPTKYPRTLATSVHKDDITGMADDITGMADDITNVGANVPCHQPTAKVTGASDQPMAQVAGSCDQPMAQVAGSCDQPGAQVNSEGAVSIISLVTNHRSEQASRVAQVTEVEWQATVVTKEEAKCEQDSDSEWLATFCDRPPDAD